MLPRTARRAAALCSQQSRQLSSSSRSGPRYEFPVIPTCPPPTCSCQAVPNDLDIDRKRRLEGTMAPYAEHVVVSTAVSDWKGRIEGDERFPLAKDLKRELKIGGPFHNPYRNILISNSSFQSPKGAPEGSNSVSLFPSGLTVSIPHGQPISTFIEGFLLPEGHANRNKEVATTGQQYKKTELQKDFLVSKIPQVTVLICGHSGRDRRCGVMGPILKTDFEEMLSKLGMGVSATASDLGNSTGASIPSHLSHQSSNISTRVGLISHIGGHAFAGNVIIYVPRGQPFREHPLAGKGIWYGRVAPQHVEGIVQQTIIKGNVIQELLRGSI